MRQALRGGPVRPVRIERRIIGDDGLGQLGRDHSRTDPRRRSRRNTGGAIGGDRSGLGVQPGQQGFGRLRGLTLRPSQFIGPKQQTLRQIKQVRQTADHLFPERAVPISAQGWLRDDATA